MSMKAAEHKNETFRPHHTYQLLIQVSTPRQICIGRLGIVSFPAGYYVYTGSASRHPETRVARHLAQTKSLHWHIDYLLTSSGVQVVGWRFFSEAECTIAGLTRGLVIAPGFGTSDCHAGCGSHRKYLGSLAKGICKGEKPWMIVPNKGVPTS